MQLTPHEADEALQAVERAGRRIRKRLEYGPAGPIMTIWGVIWILGYTFISFWPAHAGWALWSGNGIGIAATIWVGWIRPHGGPVRSQSDQRVRWRLGLFWFALFAYAAMWLAILWPWHGAQMAVYAVTVIMFAYIVMGLWLELPFMIGVGLVVTALTGGGYFLAAAALPWLRPYLGLWIGWGGGGALLASGIHLIVRQARHA